MDDSRASPLPCFPEPTTPDPTPGRRRESRASWLRRSTWSRAIETRRFYNENLAALPADAAAAICNRLQAGDTDAPTFELIVGRFLQLRGGQDLAWEPEGAGGRRVDWRATFPDGVLHVEAMGPVYNAEVGVTMRWRARLLDAIEDRIPQGWWVMPHRLPHVDENVAIGPFRATVERLLAQLPPPETVARDTPIELGGSVAQGWVELAAFPATGRGGLGGEGGVAYFDNSELVVANAWADRRKRAQGRSVAPPALLALRGGFEGADLEAFETALFGPDASRGRTPEGVMATDRRPPWAGVLAFPRIGVSEGQDPVVFVSPVYTAELPAAVDRLEVRRLVPGGVAVQPARDQDVLAGMRFARLRA